jgi:hypothetical protein
MPVNLPYPDSQLESVTLDGNSVPFAEVRSAKYELELPLEKLFQGRVDIKCTWSMPLETLTQVEDGYQTELRSLIPVVSYRLIIKLDPDCGYDFTKDPTKRRFRPFRWNSDKTESYFGSCLITIRESDNAVNQ